MHPLQKLADELGVTVNRLATRSGTARSNLRDKIHRNLPVKTMQVKTIASMSRNTGFSPGELLDKLLAYEGEN